ncbi:MAG: DUF2516 family protein [Beutenbergiaceae bacterium]
MGVIGSIQLFLFLGLALIGVALEVWALVHALRMPQASFTAADKRTKTFWVTILAVATAVGFLGIPPPLGISVLPVFFVLLACVPAGIYLADVRPEVTRYSGRRRPDEDRW